MFKLICVTNRLLCEDDFFARMEKIASTHVDAVILREKDLSPSDYEEMAKKTIKICDKYETPLILHSFADIAIKLKVKRIHLPLAKLRELPPEDKKYFEEIGASCHSLKDAKEAEKFGCAYVTAGHIFDTDCKKGILGRGLDFLQNICENVSVPVYAIGGITPLNAAKIKNAGAEGCCVMSWFMKNDNVVFA